ncbi:MAG: hypothetical protein AAB460_02835 [Patescibacteria group bacterium]
MKVLFICKGNYFRSQMAAAIYNRLTETEGAVSVGTYPGAPEEPEGQVLVNLFETDDFFNLMEKNGMNVRANTTKRLHPQMLKDFDIVVSMAEEPYIPDFLKNDQKVIRWNVEDSVRVDKKAAEDTYKKIEPLVRELIKEHNLKTLT